MNKRTARKIFMNQGWTGGKDRIARTRAGVAPRGNRPWHAHVRQYSGAQVSTSIRVLDRRGAL